MIGQNEESLENYQNAITRLSSLAPSDRNDDQVVLSRCQAALNAANLLATLGDRVAACKMLSTAINDLEPFMEISADHVGFRNTLFMLYANRGEYGDLTSEEDTVLADWERAIELAAPPITGIIASSD